KDAKIAEINVARAVLRLAENALPESRSVEKHVGYFLIDEGRLQLERETGYRPRIGERSLRLLQRNASLFYLGAFVSVTLLIVGLISIVVFVGHGSVAKTILAALLSLIPASDLVIGVLNWDITHVCPPRLLPKVD